MWPCGAAATAAEGDAALDNPTRLRNYLSQRVHHWCLSPTRQHGVDVVEKDSVYAHIKIVTGRTL
jgi:hypothetical protein